MADDLMAQVSSEPKGRALRRYVLDVVETVVLALIVFFAVRTVVHNFRVVGSSMEPSVHDGEYVLVNKAVYWSIDVAQVKRLLPFIPGEGVVYPFHLPRQGEVVIFRYPRDPSRDYIKRIIATPGQVVEIRDRRVWVDGEPLAEPYIQEAPVYAMAPQQVPAGHYFVLGDNRNQSSDSHVWGMVPLDNIVGKAWLRYWPLNAFGLMPNYFKVG